jgi:ABC-type phosphate transport system substrate-binding protein
VARRQLALLFLLLILTGCGGAATPEPTPAPRPVLVTSPGLEPMVTGWLKAYVDVAGPLAFDLDVRAPSASLAVGETRIQGTPPGDDQFATPLGREAVAVIVHPGVSKRDFTLAELADIFSGRTTDWQALGGGSADILPVIPLPGDSLRLAFETSVVDPSPFASGARLAPTPAEAVRLTAETPGAIGLIPLSQPSDGVRIVRVEGKLPDPAHLDSGQYPLTIDVIAIGSTAPADPIYRFLEWRQAEGATPSP